MELDNLKTIWKKHQAQTILEQEKGESEIQRILQEKTKGTMKSLEVSYTKEFKYGRIIIYLAILYSIYNLWADFGIASITLFVFETAMLALIESFYPYFKKKILKIKEKDDNLKDYIQDVIHNLSSYILFGKKLTFYLGLVCVPLMMFIAAFSEKPEILADTERTLKMLAFIFICSTILVALMWFLAKYLYEKFYRNHLNNLKSYLSQLEDLEQY